MTKKVLDVGNCGPDNFALKELVSQQFSATVIQAHNQQEALELLKQQPFDLVTVNRLMDRDGSSGLEIIKAIKADDSISATPVMMVTNFPDHQELAVAAGAEPGYGKAKLTDEATIALLGKFLS